MSIATSACLNFPIEIDDDDNGGGDDDDDDAEDDFSRPAAAAARPMSRGPGDALDPIHVDDADDDAALELAMLAASSAPHPVRC